MDLLQTSRQRQQTAWIVEGELRLPSAGTSVVEQVSGDRQLAAGRTASDLARPSHHPGPHGGSLGRLQPRSPTAIASSASSGRRHGDGLSRAGPASTSARSRSRCCSPSSPPCSAPSGSSRRSGPPRGLQHPHILPLFDSGDRRRVAVLRDAVRRGRDAARPARSRAGSSRSTKRCASRARWPTRWTTRTGTASSTATSSPRTSCCTTATPMVADFGIALAVQPRRRHRG